MKSKKLKCERCGYVWNSKCINPKSCPRCKRYDWKKKEGGKSKC